MHNCIHLTSNLILNQFYIVMLLNMLHYLNLKKNTCFQSNTLNLKYIRNLTCILYIQHIYLLHVHVPAEEPVEAQYKDFVLSQDKFYEQEVLYNCKFPINLNYLIKNYLKKIIYKNTTIDTRPKRSSITCTYSIITN